MIGRDRIIDVGLGKMQRLVRQAQKPEHAHKVHPSCYALIGLKPYEMRAMSGRGVTLEHALDMLP